MAAVQGLVGPVYTWKVLHFCSGHQLTSSDASDLIAFEHDRLQIGPGSIYGCSIARGSTAYDH